MTRMPIVANEIDRERTATAKLEEEFRNDPLIQEALTLFDAKIAKIA